MKRDNCAFSPEMLILVKLNYLAESMYLTVTEMKSRLIGQLQDLALFYILKWLYFLTLVNIKMPSHLCVPHCIYEKKSNGEKKLFKELLALHYHPTCPFS